LSARRSIVVISGGTVKGYSDLAAVVLLLDETLKAAAPLADRATLERICPYALLRQAYTEAYEARKIDGYHTNEF
jgi:hypothetical protein